MRHRVFFTILLLVTPSVLLAQFRDVDSAMAGIARGFEHGETQPLVNGVSSDEKVQLQFPGLVSGSGFFGRDQASYLFDELFNKTKPSGFERVSARRVSAQNQYQITAKWAIVVEGKSTERDLYITLQSKDGKDPWSLVSVRTSGQ